MLTKVLIEITCVIIACYTGIVAYYSMDKFYRLLFIQLLTWLILYILARVVTNYQKMHDLPRNNQWVFNLQILMETTLLSLSVSLCGYIKNKLAIILPYMIFTIIFAFGIISNGVFLLNIKAYLFECLLMTGYLCYILFRCFSNKIDGSKKSPLIWSVTGMLVYFTCNMPYFGLFNFLNTFYIHLSEDLHEIIIDTVSNIRYFSLAVAFWLISQSPLNTKRFELH